MDFNQPTSVYIKKIASFLCGILRILGLWKPFGKSNSKFIYYSTYSVIFLSIFSLIYSALMVCDIFFLTDVNDLTNRLYMSLTETALAIKVINFFFHNREWQKCLSDLKKFKINTIEEEKIIRKSAWIFQILIVVYFFFPNCAIHASGITPLFSKDTKLIFSGWYPGFDWQNNRQDYWYIYAYQYIGIIITCNLNVGIDSYYCFVMHTLSAQIRIFGRRLSLIHVVDNDDSIEKNRLNLIDKIHAHQQMNSTFEIIQDNLQWAYFCQVLLSSIVICSITKELARVSNLFESINFGFFSISDFFQASISEETVLFISTVFMVTSFMLQIFLMCLFGQETSSAYDFLSYELYCCDWPEMIALSNRRKLKNCEMIITIFMETLKRESQVMVGKVFPLSLKTFTSVKIKKKKLIFLTD